MLATATGEAIFSETKSGRMKSAAESVVALARALGLDATQLLRMILRENFAGNQFPTVERIRAMRAEHLAPKQDDVGLRTHPADAYYHHEVSARLDERNQRFLERIAIERALSQRRIAG